MARRNKAEEELDAPDVDLDTVNDETTPETEPTNDTDPPTPVKDAHPTIFEIRFEGGCWKVMGSDGRRVLGRFASISEARRFQKSEAANREADLANRKLVKRVDEKK